MSIYAKNTKLALEQSTWLSLQEYGRALASPCLSHLSSLLHFQASDSSAAQASIPGKTISRLLSTKQRVGGEESEKINVCPEESHFPALRCCCDSSRGERRKKKTLMKTEARGDQPHGARWEWTWFFLCLSPSVISISLHPSIPETAHIGRCHCYTKPGSELILYLALFISM